MSMYNELFTREYTYKYEYSNISKHDLYFETKTGSSKIKWFLEAITYPEPEIPSLNNRGIQAFDKKSCISSTIPQHFLNTAYTLPQHLLATSLTFPRLFLKPSSTLPPHFLYTFSILSLNFWHIFNNIELLSPQFTDSSLTLSWQILVTSSRLPQHFLELFNHLSLNMQETTSKYLRLEADTTSMRLA